MIPRTGLAPGIVRHRGTIESTINNTKRGLDIAETAYQALPGQVAALTLTTFHASVLRELDREGQVFGALGNGPAVTAAISGARLAPRA